MNELASPIQSAPTEESLDEPTAAGFQQSSTVADRPTVSSHAKLRWVQRARGFDRDLASVWSKSRALELARPCGFSEVRHDAQSDTLLCARDGHIVTVLHASHEPLREPRDAETLHCAGCSRPRDSRNTKCRECGTRPVVGHQHTNRLFNGGNN